MDDFQKLFSTTHGSVVHYVDCNSLVRDANSHEIALGSNVVTHCLTSVQISNCQGMSHLKTLTMRLCHHLYLSVTLSPKALLGTIETNPSFMLFGQPLRISYILVAHSVGVTLPNKNIINDYFKITYTWQPTPMVSWCHMLKWAAHNNKGMCRFLIVHCLLIVRTYVVVAFCKIKLFSMEDWSPWTHM